MRIYRTSYAINWLNQKASIPEYPYKKIELKTNKRNKNNNDETSKSNNSNSDWDFVCSSIVCSSVIASDF